MSRMSIAMEQSELTLGRLISKDSRVGGKYSDTSNAKCILLVIQISCAIAYGNHIIDGIKGNMQSEVVRREGVRSL